MWINPRRDELIGAATAEATHEAGERLLGLARGRGDEVLRLDLCHYEDRPYCSIRIWARGADGAEYPTRKGCSIRLNEMRQVASALIELADRLDVPALKPGRRPGAGPTGPSSTTRSRRGRISRPASSTAPASASATAVADRFRGDTTATPLLPWAPAVDFDELHSAPGGVGESG